MTKDLHLVGNDYQWLLTIFYITYIVFEFQVLMWKIVPPQYVFSETGPSSETRLWVSRAVSGLVAFADIFRGSKTPLDMPMLTPKSLTAFG